MSPWLDRVGVLAAALASMATSAIHPPAVPGPPAGPPDTSEDCAEVMVLGVEPRGPDVALLVHLDNRTSHACVIAFGRVELQGQSSGGMAVGAVASPREEHVDAQTARDVTFLLAPPYPIGCPPTAKLVLETSQRSVPPTSPWTGHATKTPPNGIELKCLPTSTIPAVVP